MTIDLIGPQKYGQKLFKFSRHSSFTGFSDNHFDNREQRIYDDTHVEKSADKKKNSTRNILPNCLFWQFLPHKIYIY